MIKIYKSRTYILRIVKYANVDRNNLEVIFNYEKLQKSARGNITNIDYLSS